MIATQLHTLSAPYRMHPDHNEARTPSGRFLPNVLRDAMGRRLVVVDMREVERRLKARVVEEEN